jgi:hypothetical protein
MGDSRDPPDEWAPIEAIAGALREELGVSIEEQPRFRHPDEAGPVNRAFRVMARTILGASRPEDDDLAPRLSDVLRRIARCRLELGLLDVREVEHVLRLEFEMAASRQGWSTAAVTRRRGRPRTAAPPAPSSRARARRH